MYLGFGLNGLVETAWSSSSPQLQNVYARCFEHWTGVAQPKRNATDSLFLHFPEHPMHTGFPSKAQPEPPPHQPERVRYYCTFLPERAEFTAAFLFAMTNFFKKYYSVSVPCSLLLTSPSHLWTC